jgi:hypothetical protein
VDITLPEVSTLSATASPEMKLIVIISMRTVVNLGFSIIFLSFGSGKTSCSLTNRLGSLKAY